MFENLPPALQAAQAASSAAFEFYMKHDRELDTDPAVAAEFERLQMVQASAWAVWEQEFQAKRRSARGG